MPKGIPNKKPEGLVYAARQSFTTLLDGVPLTVPKGATVREGHKLLDGRESLFEKLRIDFDLADDEPADEPDPEPIAPVKLVQPAPPPPPPAGTKPAA